VIVNRVAHIITYVLVFLWVLIQGGWILLRGRALKLMGKDRSGER